MSTSSDTPAPVVYARKSQPVVLEPPVNPLADNAPLPSPGEIIPLVPVETELSTEEVIRALDPTVTLAAIANNLFLKNENEILNNVPHGLNDSAKLSEAEGNANESDNIGDLDVEPKEEFVEVVTTKSTPRRSIPPKKQVFRPFDCMSCPQKEFNNQDTFEAHLCNADHSLPQFRCRFCEGSTFQLESSWEEHEKAHGENRTKIFQAGHGETSKRKPSIGKKSSVVAVPSSVHHLQTPSSSQKKVDSGLPLKKRGRPPSKHAQTPAHPTAAKSQPQKRKISEKLQPALDKKSVGGEPGTSVPSTPVSNGNSNVLSKDEQKPTGGTVPTPAQDPNITPNSGQRSQRKRVPPKWCENMIMEYEVTSLAGRGGRSPAANSSPTVSEISKEKMKSAVVLTKRIEKNSKAGEAKGNTTSKVVTPVEKTKPNPKTLSIAEDKSQIKRNDKNAIPSKPEDVAVKVIKQIEVAKPSPTISPLVDDKSQSTAVLSKSNQQSPASSKPVEVVHENPKPTVPVVDEKPQLVPTVKANVKENMAGKQAVEEIKPSSQIPPVLDDKSNNRTMPHTPTHVGPSLISRRSHQRDEVVVNEKNHISPKPTDVKGNDTGITRAEETNSKLKLVQKIPPVNTSATHKNIPQIQTQAGPSILIRRGNRRQPTMHSATVSKPPAPIVSPKPNDNSRIRISSKPADLVDAVTDTGSKEDETRPSPKMSPQVKLAKAEIILPTSDALPVGPTTRKRKRRRDLLEELLMDTEQISKAVTNGTSTAKSPEGDPSKRARQSNSSPDKPATSPTKKSLYPSPRLTESKSDASNNGGTVGEQGAALNGFIGSPIALTGSGQSTSFVGMPRLLNQSGVPILDDSDNSSEDEDPSLPTSATPSNCSSSRPYIKDVVIRFLEKKISNRNMLRIREELMTLKEGGNYFRLTKTAPLAAGLVHDMFCQSFGTQDPPQEDEEMQ